MHMIIRLSKSLIILAIAFFVSLVVFGNISDYHTNYQYVRHVLSMDDVFPDTAIRYRAIIAPVGYTIAYNSIIFFEGLTALLCWIGGVVLLYNLKKEAVVFNQKKKWAVMGLTLGFLIWQVGFMSVGGEWFGTWMSERLNTGPTAFRIFILMLIALVYLVQKDEDTR
ncbi:DUF2165 domain-containing protein [Chryseobacterium sp.]|uniref:DUF2165 family protein n=1 Tax=Chryseobacterium sp. TaxID=1871047 RepID=UPI0025B97A2E|nr:DUF2165 domain-containing protein [Chryseobacterium sp.]MBV8325177.1 DUF2165 domain-containing protein [Chryseobacterium sp.]